MPGIEVTNAGEGAAHTQRQTRRQGRSFNPGLFEFNRSLTVFDDDRKGHHRSELVVHVGRHGKFRFSQRKALRREASFTTEWESRDVVVAGVIAVGPGLPLQRDTNSRIERVIPRSGSAAGRSRGISHLRLLRNIRRLVHWRSGPCRLSGGLSGRWVGRSFGRLFSGLFSGLFS